MINLGIFRINLANQPLNPKEKHTTSTRTNIAKIGTNQPASTPRLGKNKRTGRYFLFYVTVGISRVYLPPEDKTITIDLIILRAIRSVIKLQHSHIAEPKRNITQSFGITIFSKLIFVV